MWKVKGLGPWGHSQARLALTSPLGTPTPPPAHSPEALFQLSPGPQPCPNPVSAAGGLGAPLWEEPLEGCCLQLPLLPRLVLLAGPRPWFVTRPCPGLLMDPVSSPHLCLPWSVPTGWKLSVRTWRVPALLPAPSSWLPWAKGAAGPHSALVELACG